VRLSACGRGCRTSSRETGPSGRGWDSAVAAGAALWLLKREGDAREELQKAEARRIDEQRRRQASLVHLLPPEVTGKGSAKMTDTMRLYTYEFVIEIVNGSAGVISDIDLAIVPAGRVFPVNDWQSGTRHPRLLPGMNWRRKLEKQWEGDADEYELPEDVTVVAGSAEFTDALGVRWRLDARTHALSQVL
jgi:hypothetical protein